ncbi:MAG: S41 family peptidase [Phycisphaerales bacterium JB047]
MMRVRLTAMMVWMLMCVAGLARGQVSPFTAVRFEDKARMIVRYEGEWVELVSIGGISTRALVRGSMLEFGPLWEKRIGEDLLDVFEAMGVVLDQTDTIDLLLRSGDDLVSVSEAPMTRANRALVLEYNLMNEPVSPDAVMRELEEIIKSHHAYASLRGVDLRELIKTETEALGDQAPVGVVRRAAQRIVAKLGDGHAGVREWRDGLPTGYLPVRFERARGGIVALHADRSGLVDESHPYIDAIDGVPLEHWIDGVRAYVPAGSDQYVEAGSLRELRALNFARNTLGREASDTATLTLRDAQGASRVEVQIPLDDRLSRSTTRVGRATGRIDEDIAYLRLARMSPEDRGSMHAWIASMREELALVTEGANGLVIDVRGNGGGLRHPILALLPCLMSAEDKPAVVNAARYRLGAGDDPHAPGGYLENRFLFPRAWPGWSDRERAAIDQFQAGFEPAWDVSEGDFSDWHYMVVSAGGDDVTRFDGPVIVLMDAGCFSATDIFLAAMGELPQVTLLGTASGGGSARSKTYEIGELEVRLATMASYQPNGMLFDGVGVPPDVTVEPDAGDLVGRGDTQLDRAIELIRGRFQESP